MTIPRETEVTASTGSEHVLGELLDQLAERMGRGESPDWKSYEREYPELADQLRQLLPTVEAIVRLGQSSDMGDPTQNRSAQSAAMSGKPTERCADADPAPRHLGDFRIRRELGRGGMGVVYEAEQLSLSRVVALKVLPFAALLDSRQLQRFRNEARAAATLDHPHIVPVYSVGTERGVHYYAMQLIDGQNLAELIAEMRSHGADAESAATASESPAAGSSPHAARHVATDDLTVDHPRGPSGACRVDLASKPDPSRSSASRGRQETAIDQLRYQQSTVRSGKSGDRRESVRAVARLGIQAAEALDYAHARGVVHRDVKPANLMVDQSGKLWVTDFGLARIEAEAGVTMSGDLLGTLRYMAPEQALGRSAVIDHRADIYSLGATLYELLTLRPAHGASGRVELIKQIASAEPPPPRRIDRTIPPELETVVLKAISKRPEDRYATAQELADDLRRFLDHHPIQATRPTLFQRARKWSYRHRTIVTTATATALAALICSSLLLAVAYHRELTEHHRAEQTLELALQATNRMYTHVAERHLSREPEMKPWQRKLLQEALHIYQQLAKYHSTDPDVRFEIVLAQLRVASIQYELGDTRAAESACRDAIADARQLVEEDPESTRFLRAVGDGLNSLGILLSSSGQYRQATNAYLEARRIRMSLIERVPERPDFQQDLGGVLSNMAGLAMQQGEWFQARELLVSAIAWQERAFAADPGNSQCREYLQKHCNRLGDVSLKLGEDAEAEKQYRRAIDLARAIVADQPDLPSAKASLASSYQDMASLVAVTSRLKEAESFRRQAMDLFQQLVDDFPNVPHYRSDLAGAQDNVAMLAVELGRPEEAQKLLEQAVANQKAALKTEPDHVAYRASIDTHYRHLANVYLASNQAERAGAAYRHAVKVARNLVEDFPEAPDHLNALGTDLKELGWLLFQRGIGKSDFDEARDACRESIAIFESLTSDHPQVVHYWSELGGALNHLSATLLFTDPFEAERLMRRSMAAAEHLPESRRQGAGFQSSLGAQLSNLGSAMLSQGYPQKARELLQEAIPHQQAALDAIPEHVGYQRFMSNHYWIFAEACWELHDYAAAKEAFRKAIDMAPEDLPSWHARLAEVYSGEDPEIRDLELALRHARLAREMEPEESSHWYRLGAVLRQVDPPAAEPAFLKSIELYEKDIERSPHLPKPKQDMGHSHNDLGALYTELGRDKEAEVAYRKALAMRSKLVAEHPDNPEYRDELTHTYHNLGHLLRTRDRLEDAEQAYREAIRLLTELVAGPGKEDPEYRDSLAGEYNSFGGMLLEDEQYQRAAAPLQRGREIARKLVGQFPDRPAYSETLAMLNANLAVLHAEAGEFAEAECVFRETIDLFQNLINNGYDTQNYRLNIAHAHSNLAELLRQNERLDEAVSEARKVVETVQQMTVRWPHASRWRTLLVESLLELADLCVSQQNPAGAETAIVEAQQVAEQLTCDNPANADFVALLADTHVKLANEFNSQSRPADAAAEFAKALDARKKAIDLRVEDRDQRFLAGQNAYFLGMMRDATGNRDDAAQALRMAVDYQHALVREAPQESVYVIDLIRSYRMLGQVLGRTPGPDSKTADEMLREAVKLAERLVEQDGDKRAYIELAASLHTRASEIQGEEKEAAVQLLEQAVALLEGAQHEGTGATELEQQLGGHLAALASLLVRDRAVDRERLTQAVQFAQRAVELAPNEYSWQTLGWVRFRNGQWTESRKALEQSMSLSANGEGDGYQWLVMAMDCHHLEEPAEAERWYRQTEVWLEENPAQQPNLGTLPAEAAGLLPREAKQEVREVNR